MSMIPTCNLSGPAMQLTRLSCLGRDAWGRPPAPRLQIESRRPPNNPRGALCALSSGSTRHCLSVLVVGQKTRCHI